MVENDVKQKINNLFSRNVKRVIEECGIDKYELAQKIGIGETQINCKLNPNSAQIFSLAEAKLLCDELAEPLDDMLIGDNND
jgi:hypothetical protein